MGRKAKEIDIELLRKKYEEIGSIKELSKIFHTSNNRMIKLLNDNKIEKKKVGNKIVLPKNIIKSIINDYEVKYLTMSEICKKYNLKIDKLRDIFKENSISASKWHGHIKNNSPSKISFLKSILSKFDSIGLDYVANYKVESNVSVSFKVGNVLVDLYKNKNLVDYDGYKFKTLLLEKRNRCITNGFKMIQVFEDEYKNTPNIVESKIIHILGVDGVSNKIQARKCIIKEIDKNDAEKFLNKNHIQGFVGSTIHLGAFYEDKIVAVMSFFNEGDEKWNLTRFASLNGYICQGIGGKLFKYFTRNYNPKEVRSFADRRWTLTNENNVYTKMGFRYEYTTPPAYYYGNGKEYKRIRREKFRKQTLSKKHDLPIEMTEIEMAKALGYGRIWDCGLFKYVWRKENEDENLAIVQGE